MKKIFFILPTLDCGGADRVSITFAKGLPKTEFTPMVINMGYKEGELKETINNVLPLISLEKKNVKFSIFSLYKLLKKEKPEYVFSSRGHVSVLILLLSVFIKNIKVIIRIPTMPSNKLYNTLKSKIISFGEILLYKKAYKVIAQTEEMKKEIIERYHISSQKTYVITNPIDKELIETKLKGSINPFSDNKTINYVAVGNVSFAKGYDILIKAFKLVLLEHYNAHLYIIGNCVGKYAQMLISKVRNENLQNHIHFEGFSSNPYIYMKYCNAYVLSSRMEGLPNVLLEANYLNRPLVATRCVPFVDRVVFDGVNGYTIDIENIEQMYLALKKILTLNYKKNELINDSMNIENIFK